MEFYEGQFFHMFNQGNNKQQVFFKIENYYFFLRKVQKYILPCADVLSYSLMPNHFHFLIRCKAFACEKSNMLKPWTKEGGLYQQNLSKSIAILLRSYTRAINVQEARTGSLFRKKTKLKDQITDDLVRDAHSNLNSDYLKICSEYIHNNPVKAGLVSAPQEWPYSSYGELYGKRQMKICNKQLASLLNLI